MQGLTLKSDSKAGKFDISIGDQQIGVKQIDISHEGKNMATLLGFNLKTQLSETDKDLNGKLSYTLDALKIQDNNFGSAQLTIAFDRFNGEGLKQFISAYNKRVQLAESVDQLASQQQMREVVMANLPALLKGNPAVSIAPLSWKKY